MRLSVFLALLPSVSAFVVPGPSTFNHNRRTTPNLWSCPTSSALRMAATNGEGSWSVVSFWRDLVESATGTKAKVDSTAADVYSELRRKVLVKKERQSLEGQLSSLIRIEGSTMSCKAEDCVRRLASELEALQDNAAAWPQKTGLAGSWKLIYSSANCSNGSGGKAKGAGSKDRLTSIEDISYVSENYRLSHSDDNVLRVYRRVVDPPARAPAATAVAASGGTAAAGDDTMAMDGGAAAATAMGGGKKKAGRAAAAAAASGRTGVAKQPLRKRMFFGFLRR